MRRQILAYDSNLMAVRVAFEDNALGQMHTHPHTQISFVESGAYLVTIGNEQSTLRAGDTFYVAPNIPHSCLCLQAGTLIDTFSPAREDFL